MGLAPYRGRPQHIRKGRPLVKDCPVFFLSHGCSLAEGHPPELGHICLEPDYDALPDQNGAWHDPVTYSMICFRVETTDERCTA